MESKAMTDEFFKAVKEGDESKVGEMLGRNRTLADSRDQQGMSPVAVATYYNHPAITDALIASGATLDLHEAAMTGRLAAVKGLVSDDPSKVNALSRDGFTALHLAAFFGHVDIAAYLIRNGADVNALANNMMKVRPLHSAVAHHQLEISKLLVDNGADVNARQQGGFTPLHEAAFGGSLELAELLLNHGADIEAKTDKGLTPLALTAEESREAGPKQAREKVAGYLKTKGAR